MGTQEHLYHSYTTQPPAQARREWQACADQRIELTAGNLSESAIVFKRNQEITVAYTEMYLPRVAYGDEMTG